MTESEFRQFYLETLDYFLWHDTLPRLLDADLWSDGRSIRGSWLISNEVLDKLGYNPPNALKFSGTSEEHGAAYSAAMARCQTDCVTAVRAILQHPGIPPWLRLKCLKDLPSLELWSNICFPEFLSPELSEVSDQRISDFLAMVPIDTQEMAKFLWKRYEIYGLEGIRACHLPWFFESEAELALPGGKDARRSGICSFRY